MKEVWTEIPDFPNYAVSNYGMVLNLETDQFLTPRPNSEGYLRVRLWNKGDVKEFYIHQLVAQAYFGAFRPGMQVKHENGDKSDNRVTNLRFRQIGIDYPERYREPKNQTKGRAIRIVETGQRFKNVRECAKYIGGDYTSIYKVIRGERISHLGFRFEFIEE